MAWYPCVIFRGGSPGHTSARYGNCAATLQTHLSVEICCYSLSTAAIANVASHEILRLGRSIGNRIKVESLLFHMQWVALTVAAIITVLHVNKTAEGSQHTITCSGIFKLESKEPATAVHTRLGVCLRV